MSYAHSSSAHWTCLATRSQPCLQAGVVEVMSAQCRVQIFVVPSKAYWTLDLLPGKFIITILTISNINLISIIRPDVKPPTDCINYDHYQGIKDDPTHERKHFQLFLPKDVFSLLSFAKF